MGFIETSYGGNVTLSNLDIDSDLNLKNEYDAIGIKRFVCQDYLGEVRASASNNTQWILTLNDITGAIYSKKFRVPSNFMQSTINILVYATNSSTAQDKGLQLMTYDPDTDSYTIKANTTIPKNTTTPTEFTLSNISINAGEIYAFYPDSTVSFYGSTGIKIQCVLSPVTGGYWEVEE